MNGSYSNSTAAGISSFEHRCMVAEHWSTSKRPSRPIPEQHRAADLHAIFHVGSACSGPSLLCLL